jgi:hypothetical protein
VYGGDAIDVSSDDGPIVLRVVRRKLVTGPPAMAVMMETKDKVDAFKMTASSWQVNYAPQASSKLKQEICKGLAKQEGGSSSLPA